MVGGDVGQDIGVIVPLQVTAKGFRPALEPFNPVGSDTGIGRFAAAT